MSADASAPARDLPAHSDYDELLATLESLEQVALEKVEGGRVYDAENERVRIKWIRIAKDVVAEKRKTLEARDLAELTEDVERLKEANGLE